MKTLSTLCLVFAFSANLLTTVEAQVNVNDSLALVDLYNSTNGSEWYHHDNWLRDPVRKWWGILVTNDGKRVREIYLYQNNLTGSIPASIGNLSELSVLLLFGNQLSGSVPKEFGSFQSFWELNLSNNKLNGPIPPELGNIVFNEYGVLDLSNNHLSGTIPLQLGKLSNIRVLNLSYNNLSGTIPPELSQVSLMDYSIVNLSHNQLSGAIPPELANLSPGDGGYITAINLDLSNNQLSGPIPPELGYFGKNYGEEIQLNLSNNQLSGPIPPQLGNLSPYEQRLYLNLSHNQLNGSIPPELGKVLGFRSLQLNNNQLSGNIPPELGNLSYLVYLDVSSNQLSGSIPKQLGSLSFYYQGYLDLSYNQLSGAIPPELGNMIYLHSLNLSHNKLSGTIPVELTNITFYSEDESSFLDLSYNQLSGTIPPEFGKTAYLAYLYLNNNQLSGNIPPSFFYEDYGYKSLRLNYNNLEGPIPATIGDSFYGELLLDHNQLSGTIPSSIAHLKDTDKYIRLYLLDLSHNRFTFAGMELIAQTFPFAKYNWQMPIPLHVNGNTLSVSAGGTLSNNAYVWYKQHKPGNITIKGDSVFHPTESGVYFVKVRNKIAKGLKLVSRAIMYTAPPSVSAVAVNKQSEIFNNSFSVYPNPAKDIIHLKTGGNVSVSLLSQAGEVLFTENINKTGSIDITSIAAGVYYLRNNSTNTSKKVSVIK